LSIGRKGYPTDRHRLSFNELQKQNALVATQQDVIKTLQIQNAEMEQRLSRLEKVLLQPTQ
jgi:Tfp pilus assembly protein PilN